ncbi:hypothetical protein BHU72_04875 [Desulfuribacillus stibiiarsenatis]|uniref:Release factor glutamine methyltransferase n=1 Tax=Desulfuribacillus stibiiarsenatis TaxID=1390249 RepID=A0A1E5L5N6_9FIRM|nr:HemK/PrmC family methyltransferase [Desulfuribacillus stibiiarsenatis]OEH85426.1 hypothetical protein BHU72_04875 [Desulfuribacillus stibiiarsenatis]
MLKTYREAYLWASSFLQQKQTQNPKFEAELLLRKVAGLERHQLFMSWDESLPEGAFQRFTESIELRGRHVPIQYILKNQEFYGRDFYVDERVLIPRPETELLVEQAMRRIGEIHELKLRVTDSNKTNPDIRILDIGTGSGVIPITITLESALKGYQLHVDAVEISSDALAVAKINGERLIENVSVSSLGHIDVKMPTWHLGDLWPGQPLSSQIHPASDQTHHAANQTYHASVELYDMILSNPPYIDLQDQAILASEVKDYEPHLALFAEDNGLAIYKRIIREARNYSLKGGWLGFEIGYGQSLDIQNLLQFEGYQDIAVYQDLAGIDRVIFAKRV